MYNEPETPNASVSQRRLKAFFGMDRERFESLVATAIDNLPEEFFTRLENVDIVVSDHPTRSQMKSTGLDHNETLLGLYEGVPQTKRGSHYGLVLPDIITIFQKPIEAMCRNDDQIAVEIEKVIKHEIAHHFGISDARLRQIENDST
ncbi:metallopeptidase family protein [Chloroflexota bacterium]